MRSKHYIIPIFVPHEGCPHNCVFCNQDSITGSSVVVDYNFVKCTADEYLKTIDRADSTIEISFFGGTFTAINLQKQKELLSAALEYKKQGYIDFIRLSTRPDYIDKLILDNLKEYSVDIIELGVQSLDEDVLDKSARGHSKEQVIEASKLIKKYGFILGHQIMLGLPDDNFSKDIKTAENIIELKPDIARIYPALVIKGTPMEKLYNQNKYAPYTLEEAVKISKIIYGMFTANKIKTIRIGLQPTEEINEGREVVAGPFHPAFRELVESSIFNEIIQNESPKDFNGVLNIFVNSRDISKLYANGKHFFNDTKRHLSTLRLNVIQNNNIDKDTIVLKWNEECKKMSLYNYFIKKYKEGNLHDL